MTQAEHMLCETVQEVTLYAWPIVYGDDNKYDKDSRDILEMLRLWAEEFESWWQTHSGDWMDEHDYILELEEFTDRKAEEYVKTMEL